MHRHMSNTSRFDTSDIDTSNPKRCHGGRHVSETYLKPQLIAAAFHFNRLLLVVVVVVVRVVGVGVCLVVLSTSTGDRRIYLLARRLRVGNNVLCTQLCASEVLTIVVGSSSYRRRRRCRCCCCRSYLVLCS
jgi:hypothetical protein